MNYCIWNDGVEELVSEGEFLKRFEAGSLPHGCLAKLETQVNYSTPVDIARDLMLRPPAVETPPLPVNPLVPCPACGHRLSQKAFNCPSCGHPLRAPEISTAKSRGVYVVLGLFLGGLGIHNFYAGRAGHGAVQLGLTLSSIALIFPIFFVAGWVLVEICTVTEGGDGVPMR